MTPGRSACGGSDPGLPPSLRVGRDRDPNPADELVVTDIVPARDELIGRGVEVSEIRHVNTDGWQPGPSPTRGKYEPYAEFADPDGNSWMLQEVPAP